MASFVKKNLLMPLWNSSASIMADIWTRCSASLYEVAPRHWTRSLKVRLLLLSLYYGYFLLFMCRFLLYGYLTTRSDGRDWALFRYDVMGYVVTYEQKLVNPLSALSIQPLIFFVIYLDYMVSLKQYPSCWGSIYELELINASNFWSLNRALKPTLHWKKPRESLTGLCRCIQWIWVPPKALERAKFDKKQPRFILLHYCPAKIRVQSIIFSMLLQAVIAIILGYTVVISIVVSILYYVLFLIPHVQSSLAYLCGLLDLLLITFCVIRSFRCILFIVHGVVVMQWSTHRQVQEHARTFLSLKRSFAKGKATLQQLTGFYLFYHRLNTKTMEEMAQSNEYYVSKLTFVSLLGNCATNVYLISALTFLDLSFLDRLDFTLLCVTQILLCLSIFTSLGALAKDVNSFGEHYYAMVAHLHRRHYLRLKLKFMFHYEAINTENQIALTCGSIGKIESNTIFEFILFYTAQIMFIFALFREQFVIMYENI